MQHRMPPEIPESEQTPETMGKWEMLEAEFINSATHVALLPTNKIFIYGCSSLDRDEFENLSDMQDGRWYPILIRLADERVLTLC